MSLLLEIHVTYLNTLTPCNVEYYDSKKFNLGQYFPIIGPIKTLY